MRQTARVILFFLTIFSSSIHAGEYRLASIDALIAMNEEPDGVVFEIITWEDNTWDWAAPMLEALTGQLRARYPDLDIALISHGNELFDLAKSNNNRSEVAMQTLQTLSDGNVEIHVCGDYAKYKHLGTNDFLPFVDVSPSGPAQLQDYINLGFDHIMLEQADVTD